MIIPLRGVTQKTPLPSDVLVAQEVFRDAKQKLVQARLKEDATAFEWMQQFLSEEKFRRDVYRDWAQSRQDPNTHSLSAWMRLHAYRVASRALPRIAPFVGMENRLVVLKPEAYEAFFTRVLQERYKRTVGVEVEGVKVFLWRSQSYWGTTNTRHSTVRVQGTRISFYSLEGRLVS